MHPELQRAVAFHRLLNNMIRFPALIYIDRDRSRGKCLLMLELLVGPLPVNLISPEMPPEAWKDHVTWIAQSLQRVTEEEEESDEDTGTR